MADCCLYGRGIPYSGIPCYHWNNPCQSHIYPTGETALHDHIAILITTISDHVSHAGIYIGKKEAVCCLSPHISDIHLSIH